MDRTLEWGGIGAMPTDPEGLKLTHADTRDMGCELAWCAWMWKCLRWKLSISELMPARVRGRGRVRVRVGVGARVGVGVRVPARS